jgi:hypothetical protein
MKKIILSLFLFFLFSFQALGAGTAELAISWSNQNADGAVGAVPTQICLEWSCVPDANGILSVAQNEVVNKTESPVLSDWVSTGMWKNCQYISQVEVVVAGCYGWKIKLLDIDGNDILGDLISKSTTQTNGKIIQLPVGIQTIALPVPSATGMKQKNSAGIYEARPFKLKIIFFR